MARKRELTVEVWQRDIEHEIERMRVDPNDYLLRQMNRGVRLEDVTYEMQMAKAWKLHGMQVYEFDPDFTASILNEKWVDLLPEVIDYAPHECFYMKLPHDANSEGTVVYIVPIENIPNFEEKYFPGATEKEGVYIGGNEKYDRRVLVNSGGKLVALCAFAIPKEHRLMLDDTPLERYPAELVANGVAYLCSANADIFKAYEPQPKLKRNNAKRRSMATWHEVGYRIGAELRAYKRASYERSPHQGGTVRPHMRRAHWHHYWVGPRDGERRLVLKWLAPTVVGAGKIESATGHKVG